MYATLITASLLKHHHMLTTGSAASIALQVIAGIVAGLAFGDWGTGALHQLLDHPDCRSWPAPWGVIATGEHHHRAGVM